MEEDKNSGNTKWPFVIQIPSALFVPVIIRWSNTPTNILNASVDGRTLQDFGLLGAAYIFFLALPIGIIGLRYAKKHPERLGKLVLPTKVLSIISVLAGVCEVGLVVLVIVAVVFGGITA